MDLRRLRTFVAVAELGTVSKAALRLRIGQPALSRQISDLQRELGLRLFDRVGRGLVLTAEGEQLLGGCRAVLGQIDVLGERVELLRRGDRGVLKLAAPPQTIESVLSTFLPRYAERFPNVHVKLTEALGRDQTPMLERGEVHIGIRHDPGDRRYESLVLPADEVLAACTPSLELGHAGTIEATPARSISAAWRPIRCCYWTRVIRFGDCSTQPAVSQTSSQTLSSRAARRIPCSRLPSSARGWRSFRRSCEPIAMH